MKGPFVLTYLFLEQRPRAFYYTFVMMTTVAVYDILKLYKEEPRPFMVESRIEAFDCMFANNFANPSEHSVAAVSIALTAFLDYNKTYRNDAGNILSNGFLRFTILAIVVIFAGFIGYSRVILGANSPGQVYLGFQIGLWLAITFHFLIRKPLMELVKDLISAKNDRLRSLAI